MSTAEEEVMSVADRAKWLQGDYLKRNSGSKSPTEFTTGNALVSEKAKFLQEEAFKKKEIAKQAEAGAPGKTA
eukprot:15353427-Ditylum_brightwellii.AAC.1